MENCEKLKLVCSNIVILLTTAVFLEYVVSVNIKISTPLPIKVSTDSFTHFCIGIASWKLASPHKSFSFLDIAICGCFSGVIDIDHFIAAKSLKLESAVALSTRPIFHSVLAIPIGSLVVWIFIKFSKITLDEIFPKLTWTSCQKFNSNFIPVIFFIAWTSHQLRDSIRRGLFVWGNISTPPVPFLLYLTLLIFIPIIVHCILLWFIQEEFEKVPTEEIV